MNTIEELKRVVNARLETDSIEDVKNYVWDLLTTDVKSIKYTESDFIEAREEFYRIRAINTFELTTLERLKLTKQYNLASCRFFTIKSAIEALK